ncbi:beta-lactamase family protein [Lutimaribacter sp. EGI FJ00015]|uniref:Beta-lactamase family protein n=1 Tax=Lutimaribacter degradans TaxID=2945989 RepID=A0ACC5ZZN0_9RHOB|nr:serine hydrolase domain-containing protein [Lutimaribacter sp. EGI FJ00013]MCM2563828.1 beta-lactamase family protein [Lutimaribacter sp. EGI FJ00013]MCO0615017.1 beta-lactamase family protein [Lutimaribacter sp. EGI FJ00015]MCO0637681.1 beta-lactamase family protein [Lutimaribacter sp. EGI FJ00014]
MLSLFALAFFGSAAPASADPLDAFQAWAKAQGARDTAMAVVRDGALIHARDADTPRDLASNSKAITALCVRSLVEDGLLSWGSPISEVLGADAPAGTVAELVTHSAGIAPDSTQLRMGFWLNEDAPRHAHVTRIVQDRKRQKGTRGAFIYNNENYALLGRIVEITTGQSYAAACRARVLAPAGVSGVLSPRFGAFAGWGGWRMSMADHARLIAHWFGPEGAVGANPLAAPHFERGDGAAYGLGMNYRTEAAGRVMSHAGAIAIPFGPKTGAFVLRLADGTVASMAYDVAVAKPDQFRALAQALSAALSPMAAGEDQDQ